MGKIYTSSHPAILNPNNEYALWRMKLARAFARTSFLASAGRGLSDAVDRFIPTDDDFQLALERKRLTAHAARMRASWWGGRLYNSLTGDNPDYAELSGSHINHLFQLIGEQAPKKLDNAYLYWLRIDFVEKALLVLSKRST